MVNDEHLNQLEAIGMARHEVRRLSVYIASVCLVPGTYCNILRSRPAVMKSNFKCFIVRSIVCVIVVFMCIN